MKSLVCVYTARLKALANNYCLFYMSQNVSTFSEAEMEEQYFRQSYLTSCRKVTTSFALSGQSDMDNIVCRPWEILSKKTH